ncbi:MAG: glycosyltransferase [Acidobacteria bacterium]|nr:glycosyltransferase [Acidobacteriota bacterium]
MATPDRVLSVIMPAYNERATLRQIVEQVLDSPWVGQLIIVDDCSQDGTRDLIRDEIAGLDPRIEVQFHERNRGKGASIRTAREHVKLPFCIIQDADLEYDPREYGRLLEPLVDGIADVVYGSRFRGEVRRVLFFWHAVGNRFLTLLSNMSTNLNISDMETCYKAFRSEIFISLPLRSERFGIEPEITAKLARLGVRLYEVPISYHGRTYAEGKKIDWKDGVSALWVIGREWMFGARDLPHGHRTLDSIAPLRSYHRFLWNTVSDSAGSRVVEIGAGIGNITQFLLNKEYLWITDVGDDYLRQLTARFDGRANIGVLRLDLTRPLAEDNAGSVRGQADTAVAFNVVEHVKDDRLALEVIRETLQQDGRLLLIVPAHPFAYGALDEELGHFRRYSHVALEAVLLEAGYEIESMTRANAFGLLGWWLNGRILRRRHVPSLQAKINNLLTPLLRLERMFRIPFGLSLVVVARRVAGDENHG